MIFMKCDEFAKRNYRSHNPRVAGSSPAGLTNDYALGTGTSGNPNKAFGKPQI